MNSVDRNSTFNYQ